MQHNIFQYIEPFGHEPPNTTDTQTKDGQMDGENCDSSSVPLTMHTNNGTNFVSFHGTTPMCWRQSLKGCHHSSSSSKNSIL